MEIREKFNGKIGSIVYIGVSGEIGRVVGSSENKNPILGDTSLDIMFPMNSGSIVKREGIPAMFVKMASYDDRHKYRQTMKRSLFRWDLGSKSFVPREDKKIGRR
jgi:hypothetical protein